MTRLTNVAAAGLVVTALGLAVAACQPQEMAQPVLDTAAPAGAMTVAEVQELVVGRTMLARDDVRKVSRAEYYSPDGTVKMKAKPDSFGMAFSFDGTYYFNEQGELCTHYPTLPVDPKEYCGHIVPLADGRHELSDGGVYERVLDGEQLYELK